MDPREFRGSRVPSTAEPPIGERPAKRPRLDEPAAENGQRLQQWRDPQVLLDCVTKQVLPHVDRVLVTLPRERLEVREIGKRVVAALTGAKFAEEYQRLNGRVSAEYELALAAQVPLEIEHLRNLPECQKNTPTPPPPPPPPPQAEPPSTAPRGLNPFSPRPQSSGVSAPVSRGPPPLETPVPISQVPQPISNGRRSVSSAPLVPAAHTPPAASGSPTLARSSTVPIPSPPSIPSTARAPQQQTAVPRYSHSPIPLPAIPNRPSLPSGLRHSSGPATEPKATRPDVIVIDDDDDDVKEPRKQAIATPAAPPNLVPVSAPNLSFAPSHVLPLSSTSPAVDPAFRSLTRRRAPPSRRPPIKRFQAPFATQPEQSTQLVATSSHNFRSRAHAQAWRENNGNNPGTGNGSTDVNGATHLSQWFSEFARPYVSAGDRESIVSGAGKLMRLDSSVLQTPATFHVDFTPSEIKSVRALVRQALGLAPREKRRDILKDLYKVLKKHQSQKSAILDAIEAQGQLPGRGRVELNEFFTDVITQRTSKDPSVLTLERDEYDRQGDLARTSRINSLLLAREITGHNGFSLRRPQNYINEFRRGLEDGLELRSEWTNCAGDISTIVWVSNDGFICGTTEHSDSHNQQYNKEGNLALGSCSSGTLRAYPDHRIVRPIVQKGENSTDAMRRSQSPWLYSSVVSSDYDTAHDRAYTSGFDRSVKIWKVEQSGSSMSLLGSWQHGGNVNFVAASKHYSGMVATAADVATDAVRIYNIQPDSISGSAYRSYSCSRVTDEHGNTVSTDKWAYFPATMQWGLADEVKHLLLVGYSPRSRTTDDFDIPEDRRDSGELCLWDGLTGERWRITSATTQNVFEVLWHPSQPSFIAATSPLGLDLDDGTRTQIRIFRPSDNAEYGGRAFSPVKILDCRAIDINELTIMPNSYSYCYVTAGCTDGRAYVWDTSQGDKPIHVLNHGAPVEEFSGDREKEDIGVKFTAWGTTPDRFYTGSSDGVVKVWNVRSLEHPLVRDLIEVPAPVSCGMFSPDRSKLVIGDASGRVFLLSLDEDEEKKAASFMKIQLPGSRQSKTIRVPKLLITHPEPPPPLVDAHGQPVQAQEDDDSGIRRARAFVASRQLECHPDPSIGAVQGPRYAETGFVCKEAHYNGDPGQPLLARWEAQQQDAVRAGVSRRAAGGRALKAVRRTPGAEQMHLRNVRAELDLASLSDETRRELVRDGVDLELMAEADCVDYGEGYGEEDYDEFYG
ncbi:hypothetical protein B0T22DRAFT_468351 [Podospora appendiculata]|uniref:Rik1-associated factor 1 n=1 Tax=Podospora appendiculata TaxID=314037 RepID=A0AAE0X354_9PEZI|nr:hypothetical protein B0T22DRAFT_468351 [Podospora appendiculata]